MNIVIGSDHAGFRLKEDLKAYLQELGHSVTDVGADSGDRPVDYPDYARACAEGVGRGDFDAGLLVCGTGIGMSIAANKVHGVRASLCGDLISAGFARSHNDANVLTMGSRITTPLVAREIARVWLSTPFAGGRHAGRIAKIAEMDGMSRPVGA